jgi:hypothetical protein
MSQEIFSKCKGLLRSRRPALEDSPVKQTARLTVTLN